MNTPVKIQVFENDSLKSFQNFKKDTLKEISNAFIEDKYRRSFGFRKCDVFLKKDTIIISFTNPYPLNETLFVKVFDQRYLIEYYENSQSKNAIPWRICSQSLVLNSIDKIVNQKLLGKLDITLTNNEKCDDSDGKIRLTGPFYSLIK